MILVDLTVGALATNCYIVADEVSQKALVIDPGGNAQRILAEINSRGLTVEAIVNTHGHMDHIGANSLLMKETGAPIMIHSADADLLTSASKNLSLMTGQLVKSEPAERLLEDGDVIRFGELQAEVIHTPGHTPGGITLKIDSNLFVGDTLFQGSVGRTDLPGGDHQTLIRSIKERILRFDDGFRVLPGHGPFTSVGDERKHNPFLCEI